MMDKVICIEVKSDRAYCCFFKGTHKMYAEVRYDLDDPINAAIDAWVAKGPSDEMVKQTNARIASLNTFANLGGSRQSLTHEECAGILQLFNESWYGITQARQTCSLDGYNYSDDSLKKAVSRMIDALKCCVANKLELYVV